MNNFIGIIIGIYLFIGLCLFIYLLKKFLEVIDALILYCETVSDSLQNIEKCVYVIQKRYILLTERESEQAIARQYLGN